MCDWLEGCPAGCGELGCEPGRPGSPRPPDRVCARPALSPGPAARTRPLKTDCCRGFCGL
jgi:hypothetical protein